MRGNHYVHNLMFGSITRVCGGTQIMDGVRNYWVYPRVCGGTFFTDVLYFQGLSPRPLIRGSLRS